MSAMSGTKVRIAVTLGIVVACIVGVAAAAAASGDAAAQRAKVIHFKMVRSSGAVAAECIPNAHAKVTVNPTGPVEVMTIDAGGLPKNTDFDLFVIQVPNAPFGVSWYQGDLETDKHGVGHGRYVGRFSVESFAVAPGTATAPKVHSADATSNPSFAPIHTYHLGLWFNTPAAAAKAGCPNTVTPFNGEHNAGIQAMSTRQAADNRGPLRRVES